MASSSSLYRKYRSQSFDELVGQEPVVRTLKNAIASGRIAHAYLFTGPRGVGKTSAARLVARAANCLSEGPDKPCNECANCVAANRDIATDLIEIDAASNTGVDNIREIIERAQFAPSVWNTKFYIVDEVHMLSTSAFNALLKTLEEPPAHTSFILATTEIHKVPATVASRCQRFDFRRIPLQAMVDRLTHICGVEGIGAEPAGLELVARQATGSLRDALSLLDQLRVYADKTITLASVQEMLGAGGSGEVAAFVDMLVAGDMAGGLRQINRVLEEGLDLRQFNRQIVEHLRDLMLVKTGAAASQTALLDVTEEMKARLQEQAASATLPQVLRWSHIFSEADTSLRSSVYGQLPLEMAFIEATLAPEEAAASARDRSAELEAGISQIGAPARSRPAAGQPAQHAQHAQQAQHKPAPPTGAPPPIHSQFGNLSEPSPTPNGKEPETTEEITPAARQPVPPPPDDEPPLAFAEDEPAGAPAAGEPRDLDYLRLHWTDVADQINARSKNMGVVFRNEDMVRPVQIQGGVCTISFRDPFHAKRSMTNAASAPYRNIIEDAVSRVLDRRVRIECITFAQEARGELGADEGPGGPGGQGGSAGGSDPAVKPAKTKPSPYETTRGKAAMNIFGIDKFEET